MSKALIFDGMELKETTFDQKKSYEFLKESVEGYIEHIPLKSLDTLGITMWGNDEAKLLDLDPSMVLAVDGKIYDFTCGNIVFTGSTEGGDTIGLSNEQIKIVKRKFKTDGIALTNLGFLQRLEY